MLELIIHEHALEHGLSEDDIRCAWNNFVKLRPRGEDFEVRIGFDGDGREVGMVGAKLANGDVVVMQSHLQFQASKRS